VRRFGLVFSLVLGYPKFGEVLRQPAGVLASDATGRSSIRPLAFCDDSRVISSAKREHILGRIRAFCLALPETSERLSHGAPTFFVRGKRAFLMVLTNHHGDGRFAIWCAAPEGVQRLLADTDPEKFFVPPYVGHRGWLGVRLDRGLDWNELAGIVEDAYAEVAPAKLVAASASESTQYPAGRTKRRG
jgi:hypothetical protein